MMTKKTKLILFIDSLGPGGSQRQLVELAKSIDREKYDPQVLIYHDLQHYRPDLNEANIPVVLIKKNSKLGLLFLVKLVLFLRHEKPDILLSFLNTPNMWARVAGKLSGVINIITSERNIDIQYSRIRMFIESILGRYSSHIVVNADSIKKILIDRVKFSDEKISVIRNGVDISYFSSPDSISVADTRKRFGIKENDFVITLPGRIAPRKTTVVLSNLWIYSKGSIQIVK